MGDAEECPPGPTVAGPDGEATPLLDTTLQLQALPHHGDQPKSGCFRVQCVLVASCVFDCLLYVQVPVNLLRASRIITFEPPPGVKANLLRTFSAVSSTRMSKVHYVHTCAVCRGHTPTWSSFLCRSLPSVLACTSSWLGSMPWSKRGFTTVHWAGPRNTSLMSQTSGWPVTHWTLGWIWCLRLVTCAGT